MARKQPELTARTRQNLMDAYWELYVSDTVDKITVKMITDRAGYNRGTFYTHFLDIEDLHNRIEDALLPSEESFKKLREATFSKNSQEIIEIFMQENKSSGEKVNFLLSSEGSLSFQNKLKGKLRELIMRYASLDVDEPEKILDYKANIVCSIFYETLSYCYDKGKELFSDEEMINLMLKIIYRGVGDMAKD